MLITIIHHTLKFKPLQCQQYQNLNPKRLGWLILQNQRTINLRRHQNLLLPSTYFIF